MTSQFGTHAPLNRGRPNARLTAVWWGFAAVITYGSIYPFDFQAAQLNGAALQQWAASCCQRPGRGDVLGNIVLFAPYGFLGMVAAGSGVTLRERLWFVSITGTLFALALQVAQIWLPSRDENLQDVLWNATGIVAGGLVGQRAAAQFGAGGRSPRVDLVPWLLIASWLVYRLIPFVPSIDFQVIKDSLKPLLLHPQPSIVGVFHDTAAWLAVAGLVKRARPQDNWGQYLWLAVLAVFALEVVIVNNAVSVTNVTGAAVALALWHGGLCRLSGLAGACATLLAVAIVTQGLSPFTLAPVSGSFAWLPFKGLLGGSMYLNVQAICEKVFLYGSLVYFLWQTRLSRTAGIMIATVIVTMVECAQVFLAGHTPEITDPLVLLIAAFAISALEARNPLAAAPQGTYRKGALPHKQSRRARSNSGQAVNLRRSQLAFLEQLARTAGDDVADVSGEIVSRFMETHPTPGSAVYLLRQSARDVAGDTWVKQQIALQPEQLRYLRRLSKAWNISLSGVVRRILAQRVDRSEIT